MCGIVGIHGKQDQAWIESMNRIQFHRGPDDAGVFRNDSVELTLASSRLAIIDVAHGKQPMSTTDGMCTIVFNGEIFNAPLLRRDLEKQGEVFLTDHSDTEVLLRLYEREGEGMLGKLNGMFAFALFDRKKNRLFCARDHAGIKPFYYYMSGTHFAFASELKSLLTLPIVERSIDMQSLWHYMSLMYVPADESIIEHVKRLPAGHFLIYSLDDKKIGIREWWRPSFLCPVERRSKNDWAGAIREGLEHAVERWTLSDVPLACSLSGGLDSSAIVGILAQAGHRVKTFSLGFKEAEENDWNELPRADAVARKWSTDHHTLVLNAENLLDDLIAMVWHLDEPYGGGLPSWRVFQSMASEVKVGLTGTGGDELFGNYGKWRFLEKGRFLPLKKDPAAISKDDFRGKFFNRFYYFPDEEKRTIFVKHEALDDTSTLLYNYFVQSDGPTIRDRAAAIDIATQLPEEFLMMTDRFSMAHSLEARTPFLDREFMELVFSIPTGMRTHPNDLKGLLREAVRDFVPLEILHAPKRGFVIPLSLWLRGRLRPLVQALLDPLRLEKQGIFKREFYDHYVMPHLESRADHTQKIWAALMFQLWHVVYMEREEVDKPTFTWEALV